MLHFGGPTIRLGLFLWLAGMPGVLAVSVVMARAAHGLPVADSLVALASVLQNAVVLAFAAWAGVALAPKVGLHAPAFEALAAGRAVGAALKPQLLSGTAAGAGAGVLLFAVTALVPLPAQPALPTFARVLYGGVTEEVLMRWGVMTLFAWFLWRFVQRQAGSIQPRFAMLAIAASALIFAAGHLPVLAAAGDLQTGTAALVLASNLPFGVLFGYLYWKWGLEAAMIAHALAHLISAAVGLLR